MSGMFPINLRYENWVSGLYVRFGKNYPNHRDRRLLLSVVAGWWYCWVRLCSSMLLAQITAATCSV